MPIEGEVAAAVRDDHVVAIAHARVQDRHHEAVGCGQHWRSGRGRDVYACVEVRVLSEGRLQRERGRAEGLRQGAANDRPRQL